MAGKKKPIGKQKTSSPPDKPASTRQAAAEAAPALRKRAEEKAGATGADNLETLSIEEARRLIHELRVHQIELEMQNQELRRTQEALEASRARYFERYDLAPVGYFTVSRQGLILEANLAAATLLGVPRGALVKQPLAGYIAPEDQDIYHRHCKQLLETGEPQVCELRMVRQDGATFWAWLEATAAQDGESGAPVWHCVVSDITDCKRAEEALRKSEERFRLAMGATSDGLWEWDVPTGQTYYSPAYFRMLGYEPGELAYTYHAWADLVHPDDRERVLAVNRDYIDNRREVMEVEFRMRAKDGQWRWILERGKAVRRDAGGKPLFMVGTHVNVTERKRAESNQRLLAEVLRLLNRGGDRSPLIRETIRLIRESMGFDAVGLRLRAGEDFPYFEQNGFSDAFVREENSLCAKRGDGDVVRDAAGWPILECTCGLVLSGRTDPGKPCFTQGGSFWTNASSELLALAPEADPRTNPRNRCIHAGYQSVALIPLRSDDEVLGLLQLNDRREGQFTPELIRFFEGLATSIGIALKRKRAEEGLQAANARLEQAAIRAEAANVAKSQFLANMSHEIRTPMTAITGFTELLLSGEWSAQEQREHLSTIQRNAEGLLAIINDILDLAKIEADQFQLEQMDWPPRQVVEDVETSMRGQANEKHLSLEVKYVDPIPSAIRTDPVRLRQILVNLVGNAIKFTNSGGVRVTVRWIPGKGARSQMQFEVADSGIGISAEGIQGLFEPFTQADMSATRRFGGTGLGLSISQRLAEMLGGQIEVESEPGKGSTFTLTIDAGPAEKAGMPEASPPASRAAEERTVAKAREALHGRVLLAEDVSEMTNLIRLTLKKTGLGLDLAENGLVAHEKAMASKAAGKPYDLILMDIRMPVMDGYEATRRLREDGWEGPIVALTAHSMRGDREKCLEAGCNDYLSKPVSQAKFFGVLERYLGRTGAATEEAPDHEQPAGRSGEGKLFDGLLDDATVDQLVDEYAMTLPAKAEVIERAFNARDLDLLAGLAHELKGVAAMYGFSRVSEKALSLKQLAAEADDVEQLLTAVSELTELCREAPNARRGKPAESADQPTDIDGSRSP